MPIGVQLDFPGGREEQYDAIRRRGDAGGATPPDGLVLHVSGPTADGWRVIAVWDTREAFDAFASGPLRRLSREVGRIGTGAEPIVTEFAVHDVLTN
jgi:hypothetical protein